MSNAVARKPKQRKRAAQPKPAPNRKPKAQARRAAGPRPRLPGARNDYLATLADPVGEQGFGIPDCNMRPTSKVHTTHRIVVSTDAQGNAAYAFKPSISTSSVNTGGVKLGLDANGVVTYMAAGAPDLGASSGAVVTPIVTANDYAEMNAQFSEYRCVSAKFEYTPTEAALSAKGTVIGCLAPRDDIVWIGETTVTSTTGLCAKYNGGNGYSVVADLADYPSAVEGPGARGLAVLYAPDDEQDRQYMPINPEDSSVTLQQQTGFKSKSFLNATTGNTDAYLFPGNVTSVNVAAPTAVAQWRNYFDLSQPTAHIVFSGCAVGTIGYIMVDVNWECVSRGESILMDSEPTFENPLELAQAGNVMKRTPCAYLPNDPNAVSTQKVQVAKAMAGDLYNGTPPKAAVEGSGFGGWLKGLLSKAAPVLGKIPVFGTVLGTGASLLSSIL